MRIIVVVSRAFCYSTDTQIQVHQLRVQEIHTPSNIWKNPGLLEEIALFTNQRLEKRSKFVEVKIKLSQSCILFFAFPSSEVAVNTFLPSVVEYLRPTNSYASLDVTTLPFLISNKASGRCHIATSSNRLTVYFSETLFPLDKE